MVDESFSIFTYVLRIRTSEHNKRYRYVGMCKNLENRINTHQRGWNKITKPYLPFVVMHTELYPTRVDARAREKWLKSGVGREYLDSLEQ